MHKTDNDHFEGYIRLLHNIARKGFARAQSAGMSLSYEDILGELQLAYVRARQSYDQSRGAFSTYLTYACLSHLNRLIEHEERATTRLGLISVEIEQDDGEESSLYEVIASEELTPDEVAEREDYAKKMLETLSVPARLIVTYLMEPPTALKRELEAVDENSELRKLAGGGPVKSSMLSLVTRFVSRLLGLSDTQTKSVQAELRALVSQ